MRVPVDQFLEQMGQYLRKYHDSLTTDEARQTIQASRLNALLKPVTKEDAQVMRDIDVDWV